MNRFGRRQRRLDLRVLQILQLEQHAGHIRLDRLLAQTQLGRGLAHIGRALAGRIEVQRVDVERVRTAH